MQGLGRMPVLFLIVYTDIINYFSPRKLSVQTDQITLYGSFVSDDSWVDVLLTQGLIHQHSNYLFFLVLGTLYAGQVAKRPIEVQNGYKTYPFFRCLRLIQSD